MPGALSLLDIGKKSLLANQTAIGVVGNNVSNANTEGYSRQKVRFEDGHYLNHKPGQLGTGANAAEVLRCFDEFIESQYNGKMSEQQRWDKLAENLKSVEMILNESGNSGINSAMTEFWKGWHTLSQSPDSNSARTALMGLASNLERAIKAADGSLARLQEQADDLIAKDVEAINGILVQIAEINTKINIDEETGKNNANGLRDKRAALVRQLAEKMDIRYIDHGRGNVTIMTTAGHTLVDRGEHFRLAFEGMQSIMDRKEGSTFEGSVQFTGSSSHEYTLEVVKGGRVGQGATFRVSIDGGATWLTDALGGGFPVAGYNGRVTLPGGDVTVSFGGRGELVAGDRFQVLPKRTLFWYETSSSAVNITPQILPDGQDNDHRLTGGSLAGYFQFRDAGIGAYREKLDTLASSLVWEVNRIHSQGAGLGRFAEVTATYEASRSDSALGGREARLTYGERLSGGNLMVYLYSGAGEKAVSAVNLDFGGGQGFDPMRHTLKDVAAAFDAVDGLSASIVDGRLQIKADKGFEFAFGSDSTGLLAALGINTFFDGSDARTLAVNQVVRSNLALVNAGHVNGAGEMNSGDNATALALAELQRKNVSMRSVTEGNVWQPLGEYFSSLVAKAGSDSQSAKFNAQYHKALVSDLRARQDAVSGVNLDEEMTSLIRLQHAYTAAAKMITTADSMLQVLLGLRH